MIRTVMGGGGNPAKVLGLFSRQGHSCFPIHTNLDRHIINALLSERFSSFTRRWWWWLVVVGG